MNDTTDIDPQRLAETRHKIANIFQLLSTLTRMRLQRAAEPESQRHLAWMLEMVAALGVLQHQLHSPGGEDFARFLEDMRAPWARSCAGRPIIIELAAEPLVVPESRASALALIVNELVLNAIAHGFPDDRAGRVQVDLARVDSERAALTVTDDGRGYDPQTVDRGRLGLWLVNGLAAQVRGGLTTTTDQGVCCRLDFPL